jgi:hypothetical protein
MSEINKARILVDGRGKRTEYDELEIGAEFAPEDRVMTLEQIDYFCQGNLDFHEWYSVDSPFGGRICPPLLNYRPPRDMFSANYNVRGLLYEYETENINPIMPGKKLHLTGKLTNKWIKKEKEFVEYQVTCIDEDGLEIFRTRRVHVLDAIPRTAPREASYMKTFNKL